MSEDNAADEAIAKRGPGRPRKFTDEERALLAETGLSAANKPSKETQTPPADVRNFYPLAPPTGTPFPYEFLVEWTDAGIYQERMNVLAKQGWEFRCFSPNGRLIFRRRLA